MCSPVDSDTPPAPPARLYGFPPIAAADARVLILGSMPGDASLAAGQYYAHPRNAFWPVLAALLGAPWPDWPYAERVTQVEAHGIAIWDVLHACQRQGSLDAAIVRDSMEPNDFAGFLQAHPRIHHILCNGQLAEQTFRRHVLPDLPRHLAARLHLVRLPSTSPAHAGLSRQAKLLQWQAALEAAGISLAMPA